MRREGARSTSIGRTGVGLVAALLLIAAVPLTASGQSPDPTGPSAEAAAKKKKAKGPNPCTRGGKKARRKCRARDRQDKLIGKPQNPKRQRLNGKAIPTKDAARCSFLDTSICMLPFPNDWYTKAANTETGRQINFQAASMPKNFSNLGIDPSDYNRADGFSPGQLIVVRVPGLTTPQALAATDPVGLDDLHGYTSKNTPIVVINARTKQRHPIWAELDMTEAPADRALQIRPAVNWDEGERYIVALRGLKGANGKVLPAGRAFRAYRDRLISKQKPLESRRAKHEALFRALKGAGIGRGNLYLTWDFTVASEDTLTKRILAMRNDAFAELGDTNLADGNGRTDGDAPGFTITDVDDFAPCTPGNCDPGEDPDTLRTVEGTIDTPCYLDEDGCPPGSQFAWSGPNAQLPSFNNAFRVDVPFRCVIPHSVDGGTSADPGRISLFGHGLLGDRFSVNGTDVGGNENNVVTCAVNWAGFSSDDLLVGVQNSLLDLSNFPQIADHVQQGFVNFLYLGRAMLHEDGFATHNAFQEDFGSGEQSLIDNTDVFYYGVSHGGIMGGSLTAVSPDFTRAVLNVPAMNHSTLLQRSIHWSDDDGGQGNNFAGIFELAYPTEKERPLTLSLIQMLWDRAESNGYAHHITDDPIAGTPPHEVLMQVAYGDHQVTNYAAEVMARTIGARIYDEPALDPGLHWDQDPFLGVPSIASFPYASGSAMVYWYGGPPSFNGVTGQGTAKPPLVNLPPSTINGFGGDPHGYILADPEGRQQLAEWLQTNGSLTPNACESGPCYSNGYTGP